MKKSNFITIILSIVLISSSITANATEIPRESAPLNAPEEAIVIAENIVGDILDKVATGMMGYTEATGYANTRIRKAVIVDKTNGYGYGILSAITQNAIRNIRDMYLRPEVYKDAEEQLKVLLADLIVEVENGRDYEDALKEAYARIYASVNPEYILETGADSCYIDLPAVDSVMFNRARKLLMYSSNVCVQGI